MGKRSKKCPYCGHRMTDEEKLLRKKTNLILQKICLTIKKGCVVVDVRVIWELDISKMLIEIDKQIKKNLPFLEYNILLNQDGKAAELIIKNLQECITSSELSPRVKKTPEKLQAEWRDNKEKHSEKKQLRQKIKINY